MTSAMMAVTGCLLLLVPSSVRAQGAPGASRSPEGAPRKEAHADPGPASGVEILEGAFANRYDVDTTGRIEMVMRNGRGSERRRVFDTVSKRVGGSLRSLGRLEEPPHLRGMTVLTIERTTRSDDTFVYLPSLRKVRRVSSAQRGDSFLGSDITYEDFERRRAEDFLVESVKRVAAEGETIYRLRLRHRRPQSYDHMELDIAEKDLAILSTRYFKRGAEAPYRVIRAPREDMVRGDGHVLPTRLVAQNLLRRTETEIRIEGLRINPSIDERVFNVTTLESGRPID